MAREERTTGHSADPAGSGLSGSVYESVWTDRYGGEHRATGLSAEKASERAEKAAKDAERDHGSGWFW